MKAVLPRRASRATLTSRASHTGLPVSASLAIKAVLAIDAVLAVEAVLPILARRAVLPVKAVLPRRASRATLTSRTGQPTLPLQPRGPRDPTIAGDSLLSLGAVSPTAEADEVCNAGSKALAVPEVQIAPFFQILIPHPQQAGVLLIPGISHRTMARQAGVVVDQSMDGLDGGKLQQGHG